MMTRRLWASVALALFGLTVATSAFAQVHHPFAIGANEGVVGHQSGFGAWLLTQESGFYRLLTGVVRRTQADPIAALTLIGLSFGYGVFHAAGPGHGKAMIAAYMVSNEVALRRGLVIAALAAILQAVVAIALVGLAAIVFNATAASMTAAAGLLEMASYAGIVALGVALVWRKGRALAASLAPSPSLVLAGAQSAMTIDMAGFSTASRFSVDDGSGAHVHGPGCGHVHMPDPASLSAARFDWKAAFVTILTAGARPCSGAILVLVFALAQGVFWAGIAAAFAMALGTAVTTGTLAIAAVHAKAWAMKLSGAGGTRGALVAQGVELAAAMCVLILGLILLTAAASGAIIAG